MYNAPVEVIHAHRCALDRRLSQLQHEIRCFDILQRLEIDHITPNPSPTRHPRGRNADMKRAEALHARQALADRLPVLADIRARDSPAAAAEPDETDPVETHRADQLQLRRRRDEQELLEGAQVVEVELGPGEEHLAGFLVAVHEAIRSMS